MKLTGAMSDALKRAAVQELRRVRSDQPGSDPWPAHPSTLAALVRHGLLATGSRRNRKGVALSAWTITDLGRLTLNPPPVLLEDRPMFLQRETWRGGDYTSEASRSIDYDPVSRCELEVVDAPARFVEAGRVRHVGAQDVRVLARALAKTGRRTA